MKNTTQTIALATIMTVLYGGGAVAQQGPGGGMGPGPGMGMGPGMGRNMPSFAGFDLDGNGSLTEQEFYQARANRIAERSQQGYPMRNLPNAPTFQSLDANGDGQLDPREFAAGQAQHRQQMMPPPVAQPVTPTKP